MSISFKKVAKHLYLSESAVEQIEAYIVEHGLNPRKDFSKTMEALTLWALQEGKPVIQPMSVYPMSVDCMMQPVEPRTDGWYRLKQCWHILWGDIGGEHE